MKSRRRIASPKAQERRLPIGLQQGFAISGMGFRHQFAQQQFSGPKCRNGSKATFSVPLADVRFTPESDRLLPFTSFSAAAIPGPGAVLSIRLDYRLT
jgi:hypothetical protein